jgi:hypothetical protein
MACWTTYWVCVRTLGSEIDSRHVRPSARCMLHDAILVGWHVGVTVRSDRERETDRVLEERL